MSEKIINGVDVSKCLYLNRENICVAFTDGKCENHTCTYKQLARQQAKEEQHETY